MPTKQTKKPRRCVAFRVTLEGAVPEGSGSRGTAPPGYSSAVILVRTEQSAAYAAPTPTQLLEFAKGVFEPEALPEVMVEVVAFMEAGSTIFDEGSLLLQLSLRTGPEDTGNADVTLVDGQYHVRSEDAENPRIGLELLAGQLRGSRGKKPRALRWFLTIAADEEDDVAPHIVITP